MSWQSHRGVLRLVTGGGRGIGLGIALALVAEGWSLAINGIRPESAVSEVLTELSADGADVVYCQGDVGRRRDRESILANFSNTSANCTYW